MIRNVVSATVDPGLLNANRQQMDRITQFHPAILKKWGIDVNAPNDGNMIAPIKILAQAQPLTGTFQASVKVTDIAGQVVELTGGSAPQVVVSDQREEFNIYLGRGLNFFSTPLQCVESPGPDLCLSSVPLEFRHLGVAPSSPPSTPRPASRLRPT